MPDRGIYIAMLIGDIINFPRLMENDTERSLRILANYTQVLDKSILDTHGQLASDYFGSGSLVWFNDPIAAARCAFRIQNKSALVQDLKMPILLMSSEATKNIKDQLDFSLISKNVDSIRNKSGVFITRDLQQSISSELYSFSNIDLPKSTYLISGDLVEVTKQSGTNKHNHVSREKRKKPNPNFIKVAIVTLISALMILLIVNGLIPKNKDPSAGLALVDKSIAVLPFTDLSTGPTNYFADGVMEDILTNLAKLKDLKVISRTSSMKYKFTNKPIGEIAQELGVNYILEGSVRQSGDKVKITAQLINALQDQHVWANSYERGLEDIFEIQSEVSQKIAEALNQRISPNLLSVFDHRPTQQIESYNALLEGRYLISLRTKDALQESLTRLEYALELDQEYADAYAEKAHALMLMSNFNFMNAAESSKRAELNALQAIQLDQSNDVAYAVLANLYADQYKWDQAEASFKIALELNPNNAIGNYWYSLLLRDLERYDEAIQFGTKATELDPLYPVIHSGHALTCLLGGRSDLAKSVLEKGKHMFDDFFSYHWVWGYYYLTTEEYEKAQDEFLLADRLNPDLHSVKRSLVYCWGKLGKVNQVNEYIMTQHSNTKEDYLGRANAYAGLGNDNDCVKYLHKLWDIGELTSNIKSSIKFKHLIGHAEFDSLLHEIEIEDGKKDQKN